MYSIITINLNNLSGLTKTVDSVLNQQSALYEYIVVDGGSTDGSVDFLQGVKDKLAFFISEKDNGIYDAMNKGIQQASGKYILFLNSGDYFYDNLSLCKLGADSHDTDIVFGNMLVNDEGVSRVQAYPSTLNMKYFRVETLPHPCTLIKRSLFNTFGLYNTTYKIVSDWAFFVDVIIKGKVSYRHVETLVSVFNLSGLSSRPESYAIIRQEMYAHLKRHYYFHYVLVKFKWIIDYYPGRIMQKLRMPVTIFV